MTALPHLRAFRISGSDASVFLHNQLSADIQGLSPGESTFACYCHPNGRVIALLLVWALDEGYRVLCSAELLEKVASRLRMFVLRDDVQIELLADQPVFAARAPSDTSTEPLDGFIYSLEKCESVPAEVFRAAELERGIAWLDNETSEQFLPQMLGLDGIGALNFRKGCFPGQEIVARTRYLGKLKRRACVARLVQTVDLHAGMKLKLAPNEISAEVVSSLPHPGGGTVVLLVARTIEPVEVSHAVVEEDSFEITVQWLGGIA